MVFAVSQMKHALDMPAVSPPAAIGNGLLSAARRMVTGRNAPAPLLFLLGPVAYHRALTPGWLIADWDLLLSVRNLYYEADEGAMLDEVAVVNPPTRVLGGIAVRF